jgi:mono/diheme cytochrome c family protein
MQRTSRHRTARDEMKYLVIALLLALLIGRPGSAVAGELSANASDLTLEGKTIYARQCARCHGFNMNNNGLLGLDLRKFPKDGHDRFVNAVRKGKLPKMPPWGDVLSANDIEALWAYVIAGSTQ